jgi:glycosyltransferase involved in cell wall biosynthesis
MKIIICTSEAFPLGMAATNRLLCYYQGLTDCGADCLVITTRHSGRIQQLNFLPLGLKYKTPGMIIKSNHKIAFWMNKYYGQIWAYFTMVTALRRGQGDVVIYSGRCLWLETALAALCKKNRVILLREESEHPGIYPIPGPKFIRPFLTKFNQINRYRLYTGLLVMTHPIYDYFMERGFSQLNMQLIPHTVSMARFAVDNECKPDQACEYIAYIGTLNEKKDGIQSLLKSFSIVLSQYPDIRLRIAGGGTREETRSCNDLIKTLHLEDKAILIGEVSSSEIPVFLSGATMLVSCRPYSLQAEYGFPTKVVEYLATGKPVVTTAYGDLNNYLIDGENAFVATSSEPAAFAMKMLDVLRDIKSANEAGQKGKELARTQFNPAQQAATIIEFSRRLKP